MSICIRLLYDLILVLPTFSAVVVASEQIAAINRDGAGERVGHLRLSS